jgi:hypothetical protein
LKEQKKKEKERLNYEENKIASPNGDNDVTSTLFHSMEQKISSIMNNNSKVPKNKEEEDDLIEEDYIWNNNGGTADVLSYSKNDNFIYVS